MPFYSQFFATISALPPSRKPQRGIVEEKTYSDPDKAEVDRCVDVALGDGWKVKCRQFSLDTGHIAVLVRRAA